MFDTLQFVVKVRKAQLLSVIWPAWLQKKLSLAHLDDKLKCIEHFDPVAEAVADR